MILTLNIRLCLIYCRDFEINFSFIEKLLFKRTFQISSCSFLINSYFETKLFCGAISFDCSQFVRWKNEFTWLFILICICIHAYCACIPELHKRSFNRITYDMESMWACMNAQFWIPSYMYIYYLYITINISGIWRCHLKWNWKQ